MRTAAASLQASRVTSFFKFVTVVMDHNVLIAVAYAHIINDAVGEREQLF